MCTLIILHRCVPDAPVVVAANRDEFHDRPTEGLALRTASHSRRPIVAPLDLRAGGTWLGVNGAGVFAAVTNRRSPATDPTRRSRGLLVMEALAADRAEDAAGALGELPAGAYNAFNLLVADDRSAHWISYAGAAERRDLPAGPHVVGNLHPDETSPKIERLRRRAATLAGPGGASPEALAAVCRDHAPRAAGGPLGSTCVHADAYGTGSSTLLRTGRASALHFAAGPPCRVPYRDSTPLLHGLGLGPAREGLQARG